MYPAHDNHKMIINGNVKCEPVEIKEMAAAKQQEFMLVFENCQYTIDQKIKLLSELIDGSTNPKDLVEYYKQRAILFYNKKNYKDVLDDFTEMEKYTQLNDQVMLAIKWISNTYLHLSTIQCEILKTIHENAKSNNDILIDLLRCCSESNVDKFFKNPNKSLSTKMKHFN